METEVVVMMSWAKECGQPLEAEKGKERMDSPREPQKEHSSADISILAL